jgi:ribosome-associated toxin RatA of RatAB toxin-antitoxin module
MSETEFPWYSKTQTIYSNKLDAEADLRLQLSTLYSRFQTDAPVHAVSPLTLRNQRTRICTSLATEQTDGEVLLLAYLPTQKPTV